MKQERKVLKEKTVGDMKLTLILTTTTYEAGEAFDLYEGYIKHGNNESKKIYECKTASHPHEWFSTTARDLKTGEYMDWITSRHSL